MNARRIALNVAAVVLLCTGTAGGAEIIFESATMGNIVNTYGGFPIVGDFQFLGVRFTLDEPAQIDQIGGHFIRYMDSP